MFEVVVEENEVRDRNGTEHHRRNKDMQVSQFEWREWPGCQTRLWLVGWTNAARAVGLSVGLSAVQERACVFLECSRRVREVLGYMSAPTDCDWLRSLPALGPVLAQSMTVTKQKKTFVASAAGDTAAPSTSLSSATTVH